MLRANSRPVSRRRLDPAAAGDRGTVLILVVAVLAMLVVMGAVYLRDASSNSQAAAIGDDREIDAAGEAALELVRGKLIDDLYGADDVLLNGSTADRDAVTNETRDEGYDHPHNDVDAWLASTNPSDIDTVDDGLTDSFGWAHLTWLGEPFLAGAGNDEAARSTNQVLEDPDPDADLAANDWADADGDGVGDSRWFVIPGSFSGDREYIAAVRVVDLSGMLNINTAMALIDADGDYSDVDADDAPRWRYPVELDLGRWLLSTTEGLGTPGRDAGLDDVERLLRARRGLLAEGKPGATTPLPMTREQREAFWLNGWEQAFPGGTGDADPLSMKSIATVENELELRLRNGLNSPSTMAEVNALMPSLTRETAGATRESTYLSVGGGSMDHETYFKHEPRHRMTVLSAAAPYHLRALDSGGAMATTPAVPLRLDSSFTETEVRDAFAEVLASDASFTPPAEFQVDQSFTDEQKREAYARQVVANLADFIDMESTGPVQLTAMPRDGAPADDHSETRYGLEALPFITEVYRQRAYKAEDWEQDTPDVNGDGSDSSDYYLMLYKNGATGYAIELRNPFHRELNLSGVFLAIGGDGFDDDGDDEVDEADEGVTVIDLGDHNGGTLGAREILIIYHDPGPGTAATDSSVEALFDDGGADWTVSSSDGGAVAQFDGDAEVKVELRIDAGDGQRLVYQRAAAKAIDDSDRAQFEHDGPQATDPGTEDPPIYRHKIVSNFGSVEGVNMMTITRSDFSGASEQRPNPLTGAPVEFDHDAGSDGVNNDGDGDVDEDDEDEQVDELGVAPAEATEKTGGAVASPSGQQLHVLEGRGWLQRAGDLMLLPVVGPTSTETIAEAWDGDDDGAAATTADAHMLDFVSSDLAGDGDLALPHAVLLMNRMMAIRYDRDTIDNDGDRVEDEADEAVQPGRVNLNTIDEATLAKLLPMDPYRDEAPTPAVMSPAEALAKQVVAYRDQLDVSDPTLYAPAGPDYSGGRAAGLGLGAWRERPGIAAVGELLPATDFLLGADSTDNKAWSSADATFRIDFTPSDSAADGVVDDREEQAMLVRWLSEVATTRSDVFAAYIVVRAYDRSRPIASGEEYLREHLVDRKRMVVILDRTPAVEGEREVIVRGRAEW